MLIRFWRDARGATTIEYCFIAGLISILILVGVTSIGTKLLNNYYGRFAAGLS